MADVGVDEVVAFDGLFFIKEISHSAIRRPRFASIQRWKELTISS